MESQSKRRDAKAIRHRKDSMKTILPLATLLSTIAIASLADAQDQSYSTKLWVHHRNLGNQKEITASQPAANPAPNLAAVSFKSPSTKPWLASKELRSQGVREPAPGDLPNAALAGTTDVVYSTKPWLRKAGGALDRLPGFEIAPLK